MKSKRQEGLIAATALLCLIGGDRCHAETSPETRAAAATLFRNFETVAYTTDVPSAFFGVSLSNLTGSEARLRLPFVQLMGALHVLSPNTLNDVTHSYRALLVGAKDFASPEGLGMVSSRDCYVGLLQGATQPNIAPDFRAARSEWIAGRQVWTWSLPPYEGYPRTTTFYAAQIAASYFVLANNLEDFEKTTVELASAESSEAAPIPVPDWAAFSAHKYWAHRSIRRRGVSDRNATGLATLSPDILALSFFADIQTGQSYTVVYTSDKSTETVPEGLRGFKLVRFHPARHGVWEARTPLPYDQTTNDDLAKVFDYLGFGVAV